MSAVHFSSEFTGGMKQATAGYIEPEEFDRLINLFENEAALYHFSASCEMNLRRILTALYDRISFLQDCLKYPRYISVIVAAAFNSNFLTDVLVRNPEYLYWILSPEAHKKFPDEKTYKTIAKDIINKFRTFGTKANQLRLLRGREILRIGVMDILGDVTLKETTARLSSLAKALNSVAFELCLQEILNKYNITKFSNKYCIAALGKLGGNELNYSSDVDFILFFDKNMRVAGTNKEYYEILTEAIQLFIQTSSEMTSKGYIYRVDFRLRPDGRNSPLCRTLKDYLRYYETRGEDWERQMLIKAGFVCGSHKLFEKFYDYLSHYVYPSSFTNSPLTQISAMKSAIEKRSGSEDNIKLFAGGIRDIEFSVQALQLLNGGRLKCLRTGNTLDAIKYLNSENLLSGDESVIFEYAYVFYRKIEHYMQLMNDTQTHLIPDDPEMLERLAVFMGFPDSSKFIKKLGNTRKQVRKIFESIVGQSRQKETKPVTELINFRDPKRASDNFKYLQTGQGLLEQKNFDRHTIESFGLIEPGLLEFLEKSYNPDAVLENFARVIKAYPFPSIWFNEFSDKRFFTAFLTLCQSAQKCIDIMTTDRTLGDILLTRQVFMEDITNPDVSPNHIIFTLCSRYVLGLIDQKTLSLTLSNFLSCKIEQIAKKHNFGLSYLIIGLGSFGSADMTLSSDADLVIIAEDVNSVPDIQTLFQNLINEILLQLKPFEIDFRLRPEGKSSQLVWDIENYSEYLETRARNWEFQSLTRMRFVSGSRQLYDRFLNRLTIRISHLDKDALKADMLEMRKKIDKQVSSAAQFSFQNFFNIKRSRGGLIEPEFIAQFLMLSEAELYSEAIGHSTEEILDMAQTYFPKFVQCNQLREALSFFRNLLIKNQVLFNTDQSSLPLDSQKRYIFAREAGYEDLNHFEEALKRIIKNSRNSFERTIIQGEL